MFSILKRRESTILFDLCKRVDSVSGQNAISEIDISGQPDFENQISDAEREHNIQFFKQFHLPMMQMAGIKADEAVILELGAGVGQLAYGTLKTIQPQAYIATDVFPTLVASLKRDLPKWSNRTSVDAALCDPQRTLFIKDNAFNVIQSHSVLHHVLDYKAAVRALFDKLARPGVIIFTEPCLESYMFLCTMIKMFARTTPLPKDVTQQIGWLTEYVEQRSGENRDNKKFLSQFGTGDKYLYSAYDLFGLADEIGARLHVQKDNRSTKGNLKYELEIRGGDPQTLDLFDRFLTDALPVGAENAYFSDLRQVFCFIK